MIYQNKIKPLQQLINRILKKKSLRIHLKKKIHILLIKEQLVN